MLQWIHTHRWQRFDSSNGIYRWKLTKRKGLWREFGDEIDLNVIITALHPHFLPTSETKCKDGFICSMVICA